MSIIKFPIKNRNHQRLTAAIAELQFELELQSAAVSEFREVGAELADKIETLEKSMAEFRANVGTINIKPLRKNSMKLAQMMHSYRENLA